MSEVYLLILRAHGLVPCSERTRILFCKEVTGGGGGGGIFKNPQVTAKGKT
jgi:hypothetical protein